MGVRKREGESIAAGGEHSPFNYELDCDNCGTYLGPLGRFSEHVSNGRAGLPAEGEKFRHAHCPVCHSNLIVTSRGSVTCYPAVLRQSPVSHEALCLVKDCPNPFGRKSAGELAMELKKAVETAAVEALKN